MRHGQRRSIALGCVILGAVTMALSLVLSGSIVTLPIFSVSMMAADIAPAVMVRVMEWRLNDSGGTEQERNGRRQPA